MSSNFIPKRQCHNSSGGCFTAGGCIFGCGLTMTNQSTVDDLVALVQRLARDLRRAAPEHALPAKALDYLRRKGLQGSPLRDTSKGGA